MIAKKIINAAIRQLENLRDSGFDSSARAQAARLKSRGVNYRRFAIFNKKWLRDAGIKTVLDIGANKGEFTVIFAELFSETVIYAFEPLLTCCEEIKKQIANYPGRIHLYNCGLGSKEVTTEFKQSSWAPASSFRAMDELHKKNYPHSSGVEIIPVEVKTLDNVLQDNKLENNIFIKMDVQGFEDEVIKGGVEIFKKAKIAVIECSFQRLYKEEPMFHGIYSLMTELGYSFSGTLKQSIQKEDDSYLQADCIFLKK